MCVCVHDIRLTLEPHEFELCRLTYPDFFQMTVQFKSSLLRGYLQDWESTYVENDHSYMWLCGLLIAGEVAAPNLLLYTRIYVYLTYIFVYTFDIYDSQNELRHCDAKTYEKILTNAFKKSVLRA